VHIDLGVLNIHNHKMASF